MRSRSSYYGVSGIASSRIDENGLNVRTMSAWQTALRLKSYLWPRERADLRLRAFFAFGLLFLSKLVGLSSPYAFKLVTDTFANATPAGQMAMGLFGLGLSYVSLYAITRVLSIALAQIRDALFAKVSQYSARQLSNATFQHIHRLSLRFHLGRKTGSLSRVIERAARGIEILVRFAIMNAIPVVIELLILLIIFGTYFDYRYVLVLIATGVAYVYFTFWASEHRMAIRRQMNEADNSSTTKAVDSLLNFETVKYFGNEGLEARRFDESIARYEQAAVSTYVSLAWLNTGQIVIFTLGLAFCLFFSVSDMVDGRQTLGDLVMVNLFLMQLYQPLNFLGTVYREIRQSLVDIGEMFSLLDESADVVDKPGARDLDVNAGKIVFEDVCFHYDEQRPVFSGVSFSVNPGEKVAIVGASGAGKSTIGRLLFRFYDVTGGRILIDGQDVRDVTQNSVRRAIGTVPQDTVLFNDTIGYNIAYGRPDATQDDIEQAAKMAQIHDFIVNQPQGYHTLVGERGLKLSGGEKQRVAIARTILKAPPILVLDEATSALDTATEKDIQQALSQVTNGRTSIVIAHRLSTVIDADQIIVLDKGRVAETGTHKELLALKEGLYATLWRRQLEVDDAKTKIMGAMADGVVGGEISVT